MGTVEYREVMNDGERKGRGDTHTYSYSQTQL